MKNIIDLLQMSPGHTQPTAYDTAWVAMLGDQAPDLSYPALKWLCDNQLPDGSWGAAYPMYYHDRVISTLAAMIALTRCGRRGTARSQIDSGSQAIERITAGLTTGLQADQSGATAGFEMIVPTLVAEAELLGLIAHQGKDRILGRLSELRAQKIAVLGQRRVNRYFTLAFSAEMAGWHDWESALDYENLREANGSVAHSPSATSYYAWTVRPGDQEALLYLRNAVLSDGGFPIAEPFEVYETAWVLWNLALLDGVTATAEYEPHLNYLRQAWQKGHGLGFTKSHSVPDGDDTAMVASLLARCGEVDEDAFQEYAEEDRFRCFPLEITTSISTNVHFLDALRTAHFPVEHSYIQRILGFLKAQQVDGTYWLDKWHTSPYYTTAHAIIACAGYYDEMVGNSIQWMLNNQDKDGSWGIYPQHTAEETAYCLQALTLWRRYHKAAVPMDVLKRGKEWLLANATSSYPALWIAKTLYVSNWVVEAEIVSALGLVEEAM